jgi:glycosyltransferase involved in cell wall biosynthesis
VADVLGLPLVISARGSDINRIGDIAFARRRMLSAAQRASALIAVSGALARAMTAMGMPAARLHVLRNGVDVDVFAPVPRHDARARLRITHAGPLVVAVGNLVAEKGFDLLIEAVARMPAARLLIVGQGPLAGTLRALAESVAPGRVDWRADMPQADLRFAYSAADVLALPSLREGWPNVVLESIACGTPVVAAEVGGVPEIIGGAHAPARIVAAREAEVWAQALDAMIARQLPVQKVREYARKFGWDEIVERQCAIYEDVVRRWPARSQALQPAMEDAHA